jgi:hypothetical protein
MTEYGTPPRSLRFDFGEFDRLSPLCDLIDDESAERVGSRALKFGSATPATITAASWLNLWYNETVPKIPGVAATA